jgi:hypothetical protein
VAAKTFNAQGIQTGGFGYINANSVAGRRNDQLIAWVTF